MLAIPRRVFMIASKVSNSSEGIQKRDNSKRKSRCCNRESDELKTIYVVQPWKLMTGRVDWRSMNLHKKQKGHRVIGDHEAIKEQSERTDNSHSTDREKKDKRSEKQHSRVHVWTKFGGSWPTAPLRTVATLWPQNIHLSELNWVSRTIEDFNVLFTPPITIKTISKKKY